MQSVAVEMALQWKKKGLFFVGGNFTGSILLCVERVPLFRLDIPDSQISSFPDFQISRFLNSQKQLPPADRLDVAFS